MNIPKRIYDLTQPIYHNCPGWPGQPLAIVDWEFQHVNYGFNSERVSFNTHTGTHIDVGYHFFADGKTLDQVPAEAFAGPMVVFDLRKTAKGDHAITPEELAPHLARVQKGDIVLLCTGYGQKRGFNEDYLHQYPYLGVPAAEALLKAGVKGVGTDALSMGGWGAPEKALCHVTLLPKDVFLLEELLIPEAIIDEKRRYFTCFPMWIKGCGGAPARAVVYEFD